MRCRLRRFFRNPRSPKLTLKTWFEHFSGKVLNISRNGETHFPTLFRQLLSMVCIDSEWHFTLHRPASNHIASHSTSKPPCAFLPLYFASIAPCFYLSIYLSIYLPIYAFVYPFLCRSISLKTLLSIGRLFDRFTCRSIYL